MVDVVGQLWRYPVKSMLGEHLDALEVARDGIRGDRGYAVTDTTTSKVASAKNPRQWPELLSCRALVASDLHSNVPPPVAIELGNRDLVRSDAPDAAVLLSEAEGTIRRGDSVVVV